MSEDSDQAMREYRAEMVEEPSQEQSMSEENQKILEQVKAEQQAKQQPASRPGWILKEGSTTLYNFPNYELLQLEYKQFLDKKVYPKGEGIVHVDPIDGRTYKFGVWQDRSGVFRPWSLLWDTTRAASATGGGIGKKAWYKFRYAIQDELDAFNARAAAVNEDKTLSLKTQGVFPIRTTTKNTDGSITTTDKLMHVAYVQERIEYG